MASGGAGASGEAPYAIGAGNAVRQPVLDEPVEDPVDGHAIDNQIARAIFDLGVSERGIGTAQQLEQPHARAGDASAVVADFVADSGGDGLSH